MLGYVDYLKENNIFYLQTASSVYEHDINTNDISQYLVSIDTNQDQYNDNLSDFIMIRESLLDSIYILSKLDYDDVIPSIINNHNTSNGFDTNFLTILVDDTFKNKCKCIFDNKYKEHKNEINNFDIYVKKHWILSIFVEIQKLLEKETNGCRVSRSNYRKFHNKAYNMMQCKAVIISVNIHRELWNIFNTSIDNRNKLNKLKHFFDTTKVYKTEPFEFLVWNNAWNDYQCAELSLKLAACCGHPMICNDNDDIKSFFNIQSKNMNLNQGKQTSCFMDKDALLFPKDPGRTIKDFEKLIFYLIKNDTNNIKHSVKHLGLMDDCSGIQMKSYVN